MSDTATELKLAADFTPATRADWLKLVEKAIKGGDFEKRLVSYSADGLRIEPLYTRNMAPPGAGIDFAARADSPGWDIRQMHIEQDPAAANAAILEDLEGGVTSIALQVASKGWPGLPCTREALARALKDVLLDACAISLVAGEATREAAGHLVALWDGAKITAGDRAGAFGADPLGTLALMGGLSQPIEKALAELGPITASALAMPRVRALRADGVPYHVAGASEAQELAAMLATLVAYLRACEAAGIGPDKALAKIEVSLAVDTDQFFGIAKLRAARRLVSRIAEACGAAASAPEVPFCAVTSYRMMAKRDPWTNMLRTTIACAAAAVGGADTITVIPFTFALGKPDRFARRIARNTQLVLMEESNLGRVRDPAGGSWYVESLTEELAKKAWELFQQIEAKGAMAAALKSGFVQDEIAKVAETRMKQVDTGRAEVTGVSAFPLLGDDGIKVEPWAAPAGKPDLKGERVKPLKVERLAERFEELRDASDAHAAATGGRPQVFLASLGAVIEHGARSTWARNFLASGGIEALTSDGYKDASEAAAAFKAGGAKAACICSSDAIYADQAEAAAKAFKAAGARLVLMAGRPGEREAALKSAGVDAFIFAGQNAVEALRAIQQSLGVGAPSR